MEIFLIILIIITCVLLVLVVLAQNPKGGGLASNFGGAGSSQLMGVKKKGDLLERLTWGFAIALIVLSL
jgi:preprotein translocase subunit SecG